MAPPPDAERIRPRLHLKFPFDASFPRIWHHHGPGSTHLWNGLNLLFPQGERFFVRSVNHYLPRLEDAPELRAQVKAFFSQEGKHAREHQAYIELLESQGYDVSGFMAMYQRFLWGFIDRYSPPPLRLAMTAALEHFTAVMSENTLTLGVFADGHPAMRQLIEWHAAEEIEHKAVAFEVLRKVAPGYAVRVAGMVVGVLALLTMWPCATVTLLRQEPGLGWRGVLRELWRAHKKDPVLVRVMWRGTKEYLRPSFHPLQNDNLHLARAHLAVIDAARPGEAEAA
ncbi:metal-dependent hydrolase [Pyxidicoccus fallax]|uniref:Metal-dependent hydrolase n=1 Tax=Pyxidicoccus fallax TaxID=394095 RepID=A0A848LJ79_9BACT|nr:metal-dependent hydrolase [Pyxidicoccus fallax]NMO17738.1 metal-dependent hydrolase [Pyxidicoccus fallax]NPC84605.1 metal-dependent hydrolase [Pyxidicoccus fallax]